ncbi:MAG: FAD-dependent thymidylate synthase [Clostridia bacterium]
MRIVEPWIKVERIDGKKIMKRIERACRTCYRSEGKITDDSYKNLINNCITRGHESVLEHEKVTVRIYSDIQSTKI